MIAVKSGLKRILVLLFIISNINVFSQEKYEKIINDGQVVESEFDVAINPLDTNNIVLVTISNHHISFFSSEIVGSIAFGISINPCTESISFSPLPVSKTRFLESVFNFFAE